MALIVAAALAVGLALATWSRVRAHPRTKRTLLAGVAVVLYAIVTVGPLSAWLTSGGLALHTAQHLALFSLIAPMLLAGIGGIGKPEAERTSMSGSVAALMMLVGVGLFWVSLLGPTVRLAHGGTVFDALLHPLLLGAGAVVHLPLASKGALRGFGAAIYLLLCEVTIGAPGIVIAWSPELLYDPVVYEHNGLGLSEATDQQLAGALILVLEEPLLAVEFAVVFIAGLADSERQLREEDEEADRAGGRWGTAPPDGPRPS